MHDKKFSGLNGTCEPGWHPPALQPFHRQVARIILWWKARYPGLPVLLAKRDANGAFKLVWLSPEDVELFGGDLPWDTNAFAEAPAEEGTWAELVGDAIAGIQGAARAGGWAGPWNSKQGKCWTSFPRA